MIKRKGRAVASLVAALALAGWAGIASAHPLGNYTVNRAVAVTVESHAISVRYVVDMAEIPAFSELQVIDRDGNGQTDSTELVDYAASACDADRSAVDLKVDGTSLSLATSDPPRLSFPAGAGGLSTLRLVCSFRAALTDGSVERAVAVADRTDDGHVGWREVTITAGQGIAILNSDVPALSPSEQLTHYPINALQTPPDVRMGSARFRSSGSGGGVTVTNPTAPTVRATADDPLASLVGGSLTPLTAVAAITLAMALGAAHAVSPGHGKTLVAAYLIGSQGSARHAATLGVTVAVTHTAGVFLLGAVTLLIGQFLVPERVIEWLSLGSGGLVILLGAGLVVRALRGNRGQTLHPHPHPHGHEHAHEHAHGETEGPAHPHSHPHGKSRDGTLRSRNVVALGLAGGMVPSASALIVLLVAITTGRLGFGLVLIVAFGSGMALVLGGLAVATTMLRGAIRAPAGLASHPTARMIARNIPLVSGLAVLVAGLSVTIGALARFA